MRSLTKNEKLVVRKLVSSSNYASPKTIGDILIELYDLSYCERNQKEDDFYKNSVVIVGHPNCEPNVYEAISLIQLLIENRYLVAKQFILNDTIGSKWNMVSLDDTRASHNEMRIFNFYNDNLWTLLNSQILATNALIDFSKDCKTIEQRRFKKSILWAKRGVLAALLMGIISAVLSTISILIALFQSVAQFIKGLFIIFL